MGRRFMMPCYHCDAPVWILYQDAGVTVGRCEKCHTTITVTRVAEGVAIPKTVPFPINRLSESLQAVAA